MYNEVAVCVNNIQNRNNAAIAACQYAEIFDGTVTAIYTKLDSTELRRWQATTSRDLVKKMFDDIDQQEANARSTFEILAKSYRCDTVWRTVSQSQGPLGEMMCTDLIVVDHPIIDDSNYGVQKSNLSRIILETKRPVLMIPNGWHQTHLPSKIVLGWNSSTEAMRAISDALPLLNSCESVAILIAGSKRLSPPDDTNLDRIQDYLMRKNVDSRVILEHGKTGQSTPEKFLHRAVEEKADLIVVGGYGHSRLREIVLGGMTDYLIRKSPLPVLFSH